MRIIAQELLTNMFNDAIMFVMENIPHDSELSRQRNAADRGLAPEASWSDINAHDLAQRHIGGTALQ